MPIIGSYLRWLQIFIQLPATFDEFMPIYGSYVIIKRGHYQIIQMLKMSAIGRIEPWVVALYMA